MSATADKRPAVKVDQSRIRLARALVDDSRRRDKHVDRRVVRVARLPLPEDTTAHD